MIRIIALLIVFIFSLPLLHTAEAAPKTTPPDLASLAEQLAPLIKQEQVLPKQKV